MLAGLLILMTPHRLARLVAFAPLQPHVTWVGALYLPCGILIVIAGVLAVPRRYVITTHLMTGAALLVIAVCYLLTQTWTRSIAFLALAAGAVMSPWLAIDHESTS